jgi:predicted amidophosphoribosyltransferase
MAAAQSERSVEEIHRHAAMAEEDKKLSTENWRKTIKASCPKCEKPLATNAKFCPECGYQLKDANKCECGAKLEPDNKFCPECGKPVA